LAPEEFAPWSNLPAAYFELGQYAKTVETSDRALALVMDDAKKQKLYARKARAQAHVSEFQGAAATPNLSNEQQERAKIVASAGSYEMSNVACDDRAALHQKLIVDVPRTKMVMCVRMKL